MAVEDYRQLKGYSDKWINERMRNEMHKGMIVRRNGKRDGYREILM